MKYSFLLHTKRQLTLSFLLLRIKWIYYILLVHALAPLKTCDTKVRGYPIRDTLSLRIIASGGVSTIEDVRALSALGIYGAIVGRAYYTGAISLPEAIEVAK